MPRRPRITGLLALGLTALWFVVDSRFPENPTSPPTRRLSTLERMQLPRLQAVQEDIARLSRQRRDVPSLPGLEDFRASCHAHAEDSTHTGGTLPEMLEGARTAGVRVILLTDHFRPPRDFMAGWRGLRDGVLFIPGSEARGFLIHPRDSILAEMNRPTPEFLGRVTTNGGLAFLSHMEERPDHPMEGLDGMEIYNRHWDAKRDRSTLIALALKCTDPRSVAELAEGLRRFPAELLASQIDYPADYLEKWDSETPRRRLTGVAANDVHHNQVFVVKMVDDSTVLLGTIVDPDEKKQRVTALLRPSIRELVRGHKPGDTVVRLDFDPYPVSFRTVCTHILAPALEETAIRDALRGGRAYVSFDWMGDATGFRFTAVHGTGDAKPDALSGDEIPLQTGLRLAAQFPLPCSRIRLIRNGAQVALGRGYTFDHRVTEAGVYRMEGWLRLDGEERCWILSNPIYVRQPGTSALRPAP
jgi:hypothetical protein